MTNKNGDLKVWWVPQLPMKAFEVPVSGLAEAALILNVLGEYDAFQFKNGVKPDYCNAGGLVEFDGDAADWFDWECPETFYCFDSVRRDPDLLASAIEARSGDNEGLDPKDESVAPQGETQNPMNYKENHSHG